MAKSYREEDKFKNVSLICTNEDEARALWMALNVNKNAIMSFHNELYERYIGECSEKALWNLFTAIDKVYRPEDF